jgi:DNA-binding response OmpR family regulator
VNVWGWPSAALSANERNLMTIVIIEDDVVVSDTLALYLRQAGLTVTVARDGHSGLALASGPEVGVVVLDLMVPGIGGLEVCKRLRLSSTVPILMLTARATEADRLTGFDLGADDYVPKPFSPREVVARVQALLRRVEQMPSTPPAPTRIGDLEIDHWGRQARVAGHAINLTPTEFRLLAALARHPGRVFTRDELVARMFGPDYDGLDRTVDVHVTNLRRKLEPKPEPTYILTAHGFGYRLATPDDV